MKQFITTLTLMFAMFAAGFCQSSKTLVKSIALEGATTASIAFVGDVKIVEWDKDFIRVSTTVEVKNFGEVILKRLVEVDRYSVQTKTDATGKLVLTMPSLEKKVIIKGVDLVEMFSYEVCIPKGMQVDVKSALSAHNSGHSL